MQNANLKNILLEKLNRILNPKFNYKFIWALFCAGAGLIGYQRFIQLGGTLEIISSDLQVKLSIPSGVDTVFLVVGCLFVLLSCFFFYQIVISKNQKEKKIKNLMRASSSIRKFLDENRRIFVNFGPNFGAGGVEDVRNDMNVWEHSKNNIIVPNNNNILSILKNIKNFSREERIVTDQMINHIEAFKIHCDNPTFDYSEHQFPMSFSDLIYQYCEDGSNGHATIYGNWVKNKAIELSLPAEKIYVFGSALYGKETTDIDILVKTSTSTIDEIKQQAELWKQITIWFKEEFSINLHLTIFTDLETDSYNKFLSKIPSHLRIDL